LNTKLSALKKLKIRLTFLRQVLTPRKLTNLLVKEIQTAMGQVRLIYVPNKLTIDIGNICNLRCPLCPTGRGDRSAAKGLMKMGDFETIVNEMAPYLTHLDLHNWGEPLLHPDLVPMIRYAKGRSVPVYMSTNLTMMDRTKAEELMATRLEKVFISCDAASPETYDLYRKGGDFETVINNIRVLVKAREQVGNTYTRLKLLFHVFKHNQHEIEKVQRLAMGLGVELVIDRMRTDMGKEILETASESIDRDKEWIPELPDYCPFDMEKKENRWPTSCRDLWTTAVVNWNGDVFPCCSVYGDQYAFGNALEKGFSAVWNNEKYRSARMEVRRGSGRTRTVCHTCKEHGFRHF
jgi:radical SAM protein with 4Fe4S-binding SPASM domain